jgi:hypothetical protein
MLRYLLASKIVGDKMENSNDVGKSSSIQLEAKSTYCVASSSPEEGVIIKLPGIGGAFAMI